MFQRRGASPTEISCCSSLPSFSLPSLPFVVSFFLCWREALVHRYQAELKNSHYNNRNCTTMIYGYLKSLSYRKIRNYRNCSD